MCTRAPPEHLSSPPSTHSARRIRISRSIRTISQLYTRPTSAISTRSASFHLALRLSRPRSRLIELGRREMLRGNFSNRARRNEHARPTTRQREISIPSFPSFFFPPSFLYRNSIFIFIADFSSRFHLSGYRYRSKQVSKRFSFLFPPLLCSLVITVLFDRFIFS